MTSVSVHPVSAVNPWLAHSARIHSIREESPGVASYELTLHDPGTASSYRFAPGQFNMLYLPGFGEAAISISSDPEQAGSLWHTVRAAGNVTRALATRQVGESIALRGPFGSAWPLDACRGFDVVLACGGIGLAPLRPAIYHVMRHRADYGRVILLYGARTPKDLLYTGEYESWRAAGIELELTVDIADSDWRGNIGVVPALFYRLRLAADRTRLLTCGPEIMMRFVIFEALARRVPRRQIYLSVERNMQCALGFCGHCQLGPTFVCKDGPVFALPTIEPYLHLDDL
jgi:NAD(P)H-flavin reductase